MEIEINHLILSAKICKSFWSRCIGMMGKKKPISFGFYFPNCNSLHTFFMRQKIDIIVVDRNQLVLRVLYNVSPWRVVSIKKGYACYEFSIGILPFIETGSQIHIKNVH